MPFFHQAACTRKLHLSQLKTNPFLKKVFRRLFQMTLIYTYVVTQFYPCFLVSAILLVMQKFWICGNGLFKRLPRVGLIIAHSLGGSRALYAVQMLIPDLHFVGA